MDPAVRPSGAEAKQPRIAREPDDGADSVVWQLGHLDDFPTPWRDALWTEVVDRLRYLERLGWKRIGADAKKPGTDSMIPPGRLQKLARERLEKLHLDDEDFILSIRVRGGIRAWGVRVAGTAICRLLWWDPEKQVDPTSKRHT